MTFPKEFFIVIISVFLQLEGRHCMYCYHSSSCFIMRSWISAQPSWLWVFFLSHPLSGCFAFCRRYAGFGTGVRDTWYSEDIPISPPAVWFLCLSKRHIWSLFMFGLVFWVCLTRNSVGTGLCLRKMATVHCWGEALDLMELDYIGQVFLRMFFPRELLKRFYRTFLLDSTF